MQKIFTFSIEKVFPSKSKLFGNLISAKYQNKDNYLYKINFLSKIMSNQFRFSVDTASDEESKV